jgi:glycosyltransferase involved in cell wall biosynthesis
MKASVLHVITTIERGGAEKQLLVLVREQIKNGFEVKIVFLKGKPELAQAFTDVGATVVNDLLGKSPIMQIFLLRKYANNQVDLIHSHLPRAELLSILTGCKPKIVFTRHNAEAFWESAPKFLSSAVARFVTKRSTRGIAISSAVQDYLSTQREVHDKSLIEVIHYGFDSEPEMIEISAGFGGEVEAKRPSKIVIGTIGRLVPQKDYPTLFTAMSSLIKEVDDVTLRIVGDGFLKEELIVLAEDLGINSNIDWVGRTAFIQDFLSRIDIFVLASIYEGFGLVLLEAIKANKPIIAANNSAIPEVLGIEYPGLFETGNAADLKLKILAVINDQALRAKLVEMSQVRLELFSPSVMQQRVSDCYRKAGMIIT